MNVLSLFDGISCGQIALNRIGLKPEKYFASEIKPEAIKVTQENFPSTIQIGDVNFITKETFGINKIDLLIGGSPCQDFSQANRERKGLNGNKSGLFYEFERILKELKEINPDIKFLLENVKMKKEYQDIISTILETEPININSKIVSAQMRNRFYWTNIEGFTKPQDKGIEFQSILTSGFTTKKKAYCILESESRPQKTNWKRFRRWRKKGFVNIVFEDESLNLFKNRILNQIELERLQTLPEGYTKILSRNEAAGVIGDAWTVDVICEFFKPLLK